jgi:hypothetical protein
MSTLGLVASVAVGALIAWSFFIGLRGALADAPPYMKGVGQPIRRNLKKAA